MELSLCKIEERTNPRQRVSKVFTIREYTLELYMSVLAEAVWSFLVYSANASRWASVAEGGFYTLLPLLNLTPT